jgi:hypothetical protein
VEDKRDLFLLSYWRGLKNGILKMSADRSSISQTLPSIVYSHDRLRQYIV